LIHSVGRNPALAKQLFGYAILGFALTEAIALFVLMMALRLCKETDADGRSAQNLEKKLRSL